MPGASTALVILILATLGRLPAQDATPTPDPDALAAALGQGQARGLEPVVDVAAAVPVPATIATTPTIFTLPGGALTVVGLAAFNTLTLALLLHTLRDQNGLARASQARLIAQRRAEVLEIFRTPDGWRWVLAQLLADAGIAGRVGQGGVLSLTASPAPSLQVAGSDNQTYVLTTRPDELRRVGLLARRQRIIPLDASLHPAARDEMQLLWVHLARERLPGQALALSRRAEWFLAVVGGG
jgi:hypothetical protein